MNPAAAFGRRMIVAAIGASVVAIGGWVSIAEAAPMYCPAGALTLSGGTSATETIGVDDDLELRLNGVTIFRNADQFATELPPIVFTADFGDQLRVIAINSFIFGGHEGIDPLYLHCDATGDIQVLDPVGIDIPSGPPGEVFSDRTFTIQFVRTPPSKKQCTKGGGGPSRNSATRATASPSWPRAARIRPPNSERPTRPAGGMPRSRPRSERRVRRAWG